MDRVGLKFAPDEREVKTCYGGCQELNNGGADESRVCSEKAYFKKKQASVHSEILSYNIRHCLPAVTAPLHC